MLFLMAFNFDQRDKISQQNIRQKPNPNIINYQGLIYYYCGQRSDTLLSPDGSLQIITNKLYNHWGCQDY